MKWMMISFPAMAMILMSILSGCRQGEKPASSKPSTEQVWNGTIVAFGDSLTEGYGVDDRDAYPARLERKLKEAGYKWRVINAGISGETSSGALSRVGWVLKLKPDIVILETGANDGLRGVDPGLTKGNIDEIVQTLKGNGVTVVVAGMRMVTNMGRDYTEAFAAIYPAVAKKRDVILIPFFLGGVAGEPGLNQADGVHPTAEGYRIVTETVYPFVRKAIEERKK